MTYPSVLFIDQTGSIGGAELSLLDIAQGYAGMKKVVLFEDGPFRARLHAAGVPVQVVAAPSSLLRVKREGHGRQDLASTPGLLLVAGRISRLARSFDVIYANTQKAFVAGVLAGRLARRRVIWHLRDILVPEHFSRGHRRLVVGLANRFASRVIANSRATMDAFVASGGRQSRVRVVYNGIPMPTTVDCAPADEVEQNSQSGMSHVEADAIRQSLGVGPGPLVGIFSRLAPWKGQHVLIESLSRLPDVQALIVGEPLFGEEPYAAELRSRAAQPGIRGRVHFAGFQDDVLRLMQTVDIVVHSSVAPEPFGRVIVEGMMAGRPVVATACGGALEIVEDGITGLLVPPGDPSALATALERLLADSEFAGSLASAGRIAARDRFSLDAMVLGVTRQIQQVAHP